MEVSVVRIFCGDSSCQPCHSVRWGASCGSATGLPGRGSSQASSKSRESNLPVSSSARSSRFRLAINFSRFFPGWMSEGAFGRTANVAASPQDSSVGGLPKYRHEAASKPTTLPPKGAWDAYNPRISCFEQRSSNRVARIASMHFCRSVRSFPRDIRITCMVIVLPPLITRPARRFPAAARKMDTGFTPGCQRNQRSSNWISAVSYFCGSVSDGGNRHCPSSAIRAPSSSPFRSVTTVE